MNIFESITAIMQDIPAIGKDKKNKQQDFMYRGIDDVMNALQPILSKYHVFVVPEIMEQTREERRTKSGTSLLYALLKIKYTFYAEDGTNISAVVIGEGMDSGDKASNKAMSVGMKYALFQVFCIPTEDVPDPDGETPPVSEPEQPQKKPQNLPQQQRNTSPCICSDCGHAIQDGTKRGGEVWPAAEIAQYTARRYGRPMCPACASDEAMRRRNENAD